MFQKMFSCFFLVIAEYKFGIASLSNKKELLQVGDPVQFQVHSTENFAVNIQATREKLRAFVEAMKGNTLNCEYLNTEWTKSEQKGIRISGNFLVI